MIPTTMFRSLAARVLTATLISSLVPSADAAMIGTEAALNTDRERIVMLLARPEMAAQLEAYGLRMNDAKARIAALTDSEVAQLAAQIDEAHVGAGGGGLIGALATVTMVALIIVLVPVVMIAGVIVLAVASPKRHGASAAATVHQP